ncbi:hypothetical protein LguiA_004201 [Lonicera macranthoides]
MDVTMEPRNKFNILEINLYFQIPQTGWEKLFISFIPTESGKSTAKTTKANVRNGTCKWADPIYETTRLIQDAKNRQFEEKLYKLVVAMVVYLSTTTVSMLYFSTSTVSMLYLSTSTVSMLYLSTSTVSIPTLLNKFGVKSNTYENRGSSRSSILGEAIINLADYVDALKPSSVALPLQGCNSGTILHVTVQLLTSKTGFREFEQQRELREGGLPMGSNLNSHDETGSGKISSPEEIANDHLDKVNSRPRLRPKSKGLPSLEKLGLNEEYTDSAVGFDGSSSTSESIYAEKNDTSSAHEIDSLKSTVSGDLNGLSQSQSPNTEKENPSNHRNSAQGSSDRVQGWAIPSSDYSADNDLVIANEENSRLRESLQVAESSIFELKLELSSLQSNAEEFGVETQKFAHQLASEMASSEELGKEVSVLKEECSKFKDDLKQLKVLKLSSESTVELNRTNLDHILQDKELIRLKGLLIVEDRVKELQNKADLGFNEREFSFLRSDFEALLSILQDLKKGTGGKENTLVREIRDISLLKSEQFDVGLYQESDFKGASDAINDRTFELVRRLDEEKVEKENLARKMDQMECYYEALIQELEENQKQMMGELQNIRNEHSTCLYTISTHKAEIESLHQEMNSQMTRFSEERRDLDSLTRELERRANTSEAALKRARLNYSIAVDQLQKDLELLSFQVLSVYETNENLIKQTFSETSEPCFEGNLDFVRNLRCQNHQVEVKEKLGGGDFHIEDLKKSLRLQEDLYKKVEEELFEMHSANLYLDVFSKALHETLLEKFTDIQLMKEKIDEFGTKFEVSHASSDLLRVKLKTAMEEIQVLHEYKATCIAKASDMLLQNQILEEKLESVSNEKCFLSKKIAECEAMMKQYRSKYEACLAEKLELENLLKLETLENENLRNEMSSLREEFKYFKDGFDDMAVSKENLQSTIDFLREKLQNLLASYDEQFGGLSLSNNFQSQNLEFKDSKFIIMKLEEIQNNACKTILRLMEEKKDLEDDKGTIEVSLSNARLEILGMKQKFKHDEHNMVAKIDMSNALVEKLQSKLDYLTSNFQITSKVEEKFAEQNKEIFADLDVFEAELQKLTSKNRDLAEEILGLDTVTEELERSKLAITKLIQENHDLTMSLKGKNEESTILESQLNSLKESLSYLQDDLNFERGLKGELEGKNADLTSRLSKVELEKSRVLHVFEEHVEKIQKESSCFTGLERQLSEMHECLIAADVELTSVRTHYETIVEMLVHNLQTSEKKLNCCIASEGRYVEENARLVKEIESLRFELEASVKQNRVFSDSNNATTVQLEECKRRLKNLEDELKTFKAGFDDMAVSKENLQSTIDFLHKKLRSLLASYDEQFGRLSLSSNFQSQNLEFIDSKFIIMKLEEIQRNASKTILRLIEEKKDLEDDKGLIELSLSDARSEILGMKQKFKHDVHNMVAKIDISNTLVEKLQLKLDSVTSKFHSTSNFEEKFANQNKEIFSNLAAFEAELQKLTSKNRDLAQEILGLDTVSEELGRSKLTVTELIQENHDLTSQLNSLKESLSYHADEVIAERQLRGELEGTIEDLTSQLSKVELEKSRVLHVYEDRVEKLQKDSSCFTGLESELLEMHDYLIAADVELTCVRTHYETLVEILVENLQSSEEKLNCCLTSEVHYMEENAKLVKEIECLRFELEASIARNSVLSDAKNAMTTQFEECKRRLETLEEENAEEDIITLILSMEELEITVIVLEAKLNEQHARLIILEDYNNECLRLKKQFNELNHKLSEQILKTEEFKNLSIHLKDLKDKAEAECLQAREKRVPEGPSVVVQESLRIAFIKEQYETKLQELRQQLSISKKYGEEMLWKLQDVVDEIENRKKSEALNLKRNEELSSKILELEGELQSVLSDKRERINDHDRIKAELECALLSLECCKEEKEKLVASLQECKVENSRITVELDLTKGQLENSKSGDRNSLMDSEELQDPNSLPNGEGGDSLELISGRSVQGILKSKSLHRIPDDSLLLDQESLLHDNSRHLAINNNHFQAQSLKSSMEHLHEELERMKNENSLLVTNFDPRFQDLQGEFTQLQKANQELGNIFPSFNELGGSGNALERVLALEIELAEALREKKKSAFQFQSSFLKQHSDEEAVFRSFRDINELIKEMLELKGKYANVETDLKEMHDRYSQLSLQFAEVEGERQKLMMTLKNIRTPKKSIQSSSANLDRPS